MSKARIYIIVTALVVLVSLVYVAWFSISDKFEKVTRVEHVGFTGSAKRNPFLAAERFLKHYRYKTVTVIQYSRSILNNSDVVVVPISALPQEDYEVAILEAWLNEGGTLLTGNMPDINVSSRSLPTRLKRIIGLESQTPFDEVSSQNFTLDIQEETIKGEMGLAHEVNAVYEANTLAEDSGNAMMYEFGSVVFFNDLSIFSNQYLRNEGHATLFYHLASQFHNSQNIVFINSLNSLTAWQWLWKNAKIPMGIFLLCLIFYILKYTKRFGPTAPVESLDRRQILEHISASGQYFWRHKEHLSLIEEVKRELKSVIFGKYPSLRDLQNDVLYIELSEITGAAKPQITEAFEGQAQNEEEFFETILTLKSLRQNL